MINLLKLKTYLALLPMYAILSLPITNYSYVAKGKSKSSQPRLWIIVPEELNTTTCLAMRDLIGLGWDLYIQKTP